MKKQSQLSTHDKLFGRGEVPLALRHRISVAADKAAEKKCYMMAKVAEIVRLSYYQSHGKAPINKLLNLLFYF